MEPCDHKMLPAELRAMDKAGQVRRRWCREPETLRCLVSRRQPGTNEPESRVLALCLEHRERYRARGWTVRAEWPSTWPVVAAS